MFESVLATVLNRILGNYISNLEQKQLNIAIWQGDVILKGLSLRKEALDGLSLPIEILEGYLGELRIKIPWQNLKGKPVEIHIDKLFLLVVPRFETKYDKNQEEERLYRWKINKLDAAELMQNDLRIDDPQDQSFINQLITKIIDNLQIHIQTVHIRYEDHVSHPEFPFSFGVTLSLLSASSTDSNWIESFVHDSSTAIHKLLKMYGLAIYCNTGTNFVRLKRETPEAFLESFEQLITKAKYSDSDPFEPIQLDSAYSHQYLLRPISGLGHLAIQKKVKPLVQKYVHEPNLLTALLDSLLSKNYLSLYFDELNICLDDQQYQELLNLSRMFQRYVTLKQYISIRPSVISLNDKPHTWFQYAGKAVLMVIHTRNFRLSWEYFKQRRDQRIEYTALYTKKLEQIAMFKVPANSALSPEDAGRLKRLEIEIDVNDLLIYRRRVTDYVQSELKQAEEKKIASEVLLSKQSSSSGWFSSLPFWASWGSSTPDNSVSPSTSNSDENAVVDVPSISVLTEKDMQQLYDTIDYHDSDSVSVGTETSTAITSIASGSKPSSPLDSSAPSTKPFYYYDLHHIQLHLKHGSLSIKSSNQVESVIELSFNNLLFQFLLRERVSDRKGSMSRSYNSIGRGNELKFGSTWLGRIEMESLVAEDSVSRHSLYKYLLKTGRFCKNDDRNEKTSFVKMAYLNLPYDEPKLDGRFESEMHSLVAIINRPLFERLASFFTSPEFSDDISENILTHATKKLEELRVYTAANIANILASHPKIQIKIGMEAPVLILPVNVESISDPLFVVDLGKLRIESDQIEFSKESLPKIDTSLFVEDESDDALDLAYEQFHCQLIRAQAHFSQSAEYYFDRIARSEIDIYSNFSEDMYVIHPVDISIMIKQCLVTKDVFLPGFKIYIQLENPLRLQLSDLSYQTAMLLFDTFFPDDENDRLHLALKERRNTILSNGNFCNGESQKSNIAVNAILSKDPAIVSRHSTNDSESESVTFFDASSSFSSGLNYSDSVPKISRKSSVQGLEAEGNNLPLQIESVDEGDVNYLRSNASDNSSIAFDEENLRRTLARSSFVVFANISSVAVSLLQSRTALEDDPAPWLNYSDSLELDALYLRIAALECTNCSFFLDKRELDLEVKLDIDSLAIPLSNLLIDTPLKSSFQFFNPYLSTDKFPNLFDYTESSNLYLVRTDSESSSPSLHFRLVRCLPIHPYFRDEYFNGKVYNLEFNLCSLKLYLRPDSICAIHMYILKTFNTPSNFIWPFQFELLKSLRENAGFFTPDNSADFMQLFSSLESYSTPLTIQLDIRLKNVGIFLLDTSSYIFMLWTLGFGDLNIDFIFSPDIPIEFQELPETKRLLQSDKKIVRGSFSNFSLKTISIQNQENDSYLNIKSNSPIIDSSPLLRFDEGDDRGAFSFSYETYTPIQVQDLLNLPSLEVINLSFLNFLPKCIDLDTKYHSFLDLKASSIIVYFKLFYFRSLMNWWNNIMFGIDRTNNTIMKLKEHKEFIPSLSHMKEEQSSQSLFHYLVVMQTPVLLINRPDDLWLPTKDCCLVVHFGSLHLHNQFVRHSPKNYDLDYRIELTLDSMAFYRIAVGTSDYYLPDQTESKTTLMAPLKQLDFEFLLTEAISDIAGVQISAITQYPVHAFLLLKDYYFLMERVLWALGQAGRFNDLNANLTISDTASQESSLNPLTAEGRPNSHSLEFVFFLQGGLSIDIFKYITYNENNSSNGTSLFCNVSLLPIQIRFLSRFDNSSELLLHVGKLRITDSCGIHILLDGFSNKANLQNSMQSPTSEKEMYNGHWQLIFELATKSNGDSLSNLVLYRPKVLLRLDIIVSLVNFILNGLPQQPPVYTDNVKNDPISHQSYSSVLVWHLEALFPVSSDISLSAHDALAAGNPYLSLLVPRCELGLRQNENRILLMDDINLRLVEPSKNFDSAILDLIDPFHLSLNTTFKQGCTSVSNTDLFDSSISQVTLSPILIKCSYQDMLMVQSLLISLQDDINKIEPFDMILPQLLTNEADSITSTTEVNSSTSRSISSSKDIVLAVPKFDFAMPYASSENFSSTSAGLSFVTSIDFTCANFRLLLIDDASAVYIPIFDVQASNLSGSYNSTLSTINSTNSKGLLKASVSIFNMNMKNSMWEPLIEPWTFRLLSETSRAYATMFDTFKLESDDRLDINITSQFLSWYQQFSNTAKYAKGSNIFSEGGIRRVRLEPYRIINLSGCELRLWKSSALVLENNENNDLNVIKLHNNQSIELSFENWRDTRRGLHPALHSLGVHFLREDIPDLPEGSSGMSRPSILFPLEWETIRQVPVYKEGFQVHIHQPPILNESERYLGNLGASSDYVHFHRFIIDVKLSNDNQKEIRILSPVVIKNPTGMAFQLGTYLRDDRFITFDLLPGESLGLPPLLAYWNKEWRLRPMNSSGGIYDWSIQSFHWTQFPDAIAEVELTCEMNSSDDTGNPFYIHLYALPQFHGTRAVDGRSSAFPLMNIVISPPFTFTNVLPFTIFYKLIDKQARIQWKGILAGYSAEKKEKEARVQLWGLSSKHLIGLAIHAVSPTDVLNASVQLDDCLYKSRDVAVVHTGEIGRLSRKIARNGTEAGLSRNSRDEKQYSDSSAALYDLGDEQLETISTLSGDVVTLGLRYYYDAMDERLRLTTMQPNINVGNINSGQHRNIYEGYWSKGIVLYAQYVILNETNLSVLIKQDGHLKSSSSMTAPIPPRRFTMDADDREFYSMYTNLDDKSKFSHQSKESSGNIAVLFSYQTGLMLKNRAMICIVSEEPNEDGMQILTDWRKGISFEALGNLNELVLAHKTLKQCSYHLSISVEATHFPCLPTMPPTLCKVVRLRYKYTLISECGDLWIRHAYQTIDSSQQSKNISPQKVTLITDHDIIPYHLSFTDRKMLAAISNLNENFDHEDMDWIYARSFLKGNEVRVALASDALEWSPPLDITVAGKFSFRLGAENPYEMEVKLIQGGLRVIFRKIETTRFLLINDTSNLSLVIYQKYTNPLSRSRTIYKLGPGEKRHFLWDLPCLSKAVSERNEDLAGASSENFLEASSGTSIKKLVICVLDGDNIRQLGELLPTQVGLVRKPFKYSLTPTGSSSKIKGSFVVDISVHGLLRHISFLDKRDVEDIETISTSTGASSSESLSVASIQNPLFGLEINLVSVGISLILSMDAYNDIIGNDALDYELVYCTLRQVLFTYRFYPETFTFGVMIGWLQVDNQTTNDVDAILLYPSVLNKASSTPDNSEPPFLKIGCIIKNNQNNKDCKGNADDIKCVPYAGILLQEITIVLEESMLRKLVSFCVPSKPSADTSLLADSIVSTSFTPSSSTHIDSNITESKSPLFYFEVFQLHPIKVNLTFTRDDAYSRNSDQTVTSHASSYSAGPISFLMDVLSVSIGNIHDAPLRFNSLLLQHPILRGTDLLDLVRGHLSQQGLTQLHRLIGSADVLGNPIGLFNSFAEGVSDLFYEPYLGFVSDRPQDFGIGLAKGSASLVRNTVYGVSDTFSKVAESLGRGIALTTLDRDFQKQRLDHRRRNTPRHALSGVEQGARSLMTSVASGLTGIVERPLEGVQKEGFSGLMKGMGKGLVGAITKPVLGVFDLAATVSKGIRNTSTSSVFLDNYQENVLEKIRLPRARYYDHVLRIYTAMDAYGQFLLFECDNGSVLSQLRQSTSRSGTFPVVYYITHIQLQNDTLILSSAGIVQLNPLHLTASFILPFSNLVRVVAGVHHICLEIGKDRDHYRRDRSTASVVDKKLLILDNDEQRDWLLRKIELARAIFSKLYL